MPQRANQKAESRAAIVRSAADLVRVGGAEGTSVQQAMRGAGLTVGAFYAHFADKTELVDAAFQAALDAMTERVLAVAADEREGSPLLRVIDEYLSEGHRDHPEFGCPLPSLLGEASHHGSPLPATSLAHGFDTMRELFMRVDPSIGRTTADALLALLVGSQVVARAVNGSPLSREVLTAARASARAMVGASPAPASETNG
jgi:TetR/AcrR family transcriptional regulator, transcriptional repressor for nem operon